MTLGRKSSQDMVETCWHLKHIENTMTGWWCNNHLEKYESQCEGLSHILWKLLKIINVWNHQPDEHKQDISLKPPIKKPMDQWGFQLRNTSFGMILGSHMLSNPKVDRGLGHKIGFCKTSRFAKEVTIHMEFSWIFEVFHGIPHLETKHDKTHVGQIQLPSFPNSFQQIQSLAISTKVAPFAMALGHRAKNSMMGRSTPLAWSWGAWVKTCLPGLVNSQFAMENHRFEWVNQL